MLIAALKVSIASQTELIKSNQARWLSESTAANAQAVDMPVKKSAEVESIIFLIACLLIQIYYSRIVVFSVLLTGFEPVPHRSRRLFFRDICVARPTPTQQRSNPTIQSSFRLYLLLLGEIQQRDEKSHEKTERTTCNSSI